MRGRNENCFITNSFVVVVVVSLQQLKYVPRSSQLLFLRLLSDRAVQNITYHCKNSVAWHSEHLTDVKRSLKFKTANGVIIHSSSSNKFKPRVITDGCRVSQKSI